MYIYKEESVKKCSEIDKREGGVEMKVFFSSIKKGRNKEEFSFTFLYFLFWKGYRKGKGSSFVLS
jgi:hypothetical protein